MRGKNDGIYRLDTSGAAGGGTQSVTVQSSSQRTTNGFKKQTRHVVLHSTTDCHVNIGKSDVTATTSDFFLKAGAYVPSVANPGEHVACIQASAAGTLYVTEMV